MWIPSLERQQAILRETEITADALDLIVALLLPQPVPESLTRGKQTEQGTWSVSEVVQQELPVGSRLGIHLACKWQARLELH